jgi:hypothetical protein
VNEPPIEVVVFDGKVRAVGAVGVAQAGYPLPDNGDVV